MSAVRHLHIIHGYENPLASKPQLELVLKGIRRTKPKSSVPCLPITLVLLTRIEEGFQKSIPSKFDITMLRAACLLAFYGFLRCSKFTIPSLQAYNPTHHSSTTDIKVDSHNTPSIITVQIKSSKTDPFGKGATIYLGKGRSSLCPVAAILQYLAIRPSDNGPLFIDHTGKPLTKPAFVTHIKQVLKAVGKKSNAYKGHSFRIGAATTAAACGLEDSTIKTLGRWSSAAFQLYIRASPSDLAQLTSRLSVVSDF